MTLRTLSISLLLALVVAAAAAQSRLSRPDFAQMRDAGDRMEAKLDYIYRNGQSQQPDSRPMELTPEEVADYFADGKTPLPAGVSGIRYSSEPGIITGRARVDFDKITAGRQSMNPLMLMFTGVHDVEVVARAEGRDGVAHVNVQSVSFDGLRIPRGALELFVERFVQPKYPNVRLENTYKMPARVNTATFGKNVLTLTQK